MSSNGVPSIASRPLTFNLFPFFSTKFTTEKPIGFGLSGDLVVKRPCGFVSQGVLTRYVYLSDLCR